MINYRSHQSTEASGDDLGKSAGGFRYPDEQRNLGQIHCQRARQDSDIIFMSGRRISLSIDNTGFGGGLSPVSSLSLLSDPDPF